MRRAILPSYVLPRSVTEYWTGGCQKTAERAKESTRNGKAMRLKQRSYVTVFVTLTILMTSMTLSPRLHAGDKPEPAHDRPEKPETRHPGPPKGRQITHEGVQYIAFTLPEWKKYGLIVVDYYRLWDYSLSLELDIRLLNKDIDTLKMRVGIWKAATEDQKQRAETLSLMHSEERKLRLSNELKQRTFGWVPWVIVVVESVAIGALGIYAGAIK